MRFVETSLQTLCDAHPGDTPRTMEELIQERSGMSGWEAWTTLINEQIKHAGASEEDSSESPPLQQVVNR